MKKRIIFTRKPYNLSEESKSGSGVSDCKVVETIKLDKDEFEDFTSDFYRESGVMFEGLRLGEVEDGLTRVLQIINSDDGHEIYVDTQGYDYARYVGYELGFESPEDLKNDIMPKNIVLSNLLQIEEYLLSDVFYVEEDIAYQNNMIEAIQQAIKVLQVATQSEINSDLKKYNKFYGGK